MQRYVLAFMTLIVSDCMDALCKLDCNMLIAYSWCLPVLCLVVASNHQPGSMLVARGTHHCQTLQWNSVGDGSLQRLFVCEICKSKYRCSLQRTCMLCAWACAWRRFYEFDLKLSCWAYETPECICRLNILQWRFQTCMLTPTILCTVQFWELDIGFMNSLNCCQKLRFWR